MSKSEIMTTAGINISQDDIICVAISEVEDTLHKHIEENKKEMCDIAAAQEKEQAEFRKRLKAAAEARFGKKVQALIKAVTEFQALSMHGEGGCRHGRDSKYANYGGAVCEDRKHISLAAETAYGNVEAKVELSEVPGAAAYLSSREASKSEYNKLAEDTVQLKLKLNDIGRLERKARAASSTVAINKIAGGKELLADIKAKFLSTEPMLRGLKG